MNKREMRVAVRQVCLRSTATVSEVAELIDRISMVVSVTKTVKYDMSGTTVVTWTVKLKNGWTFKIS